MLKQKEFDLIVSDFKQKDMKGYDKWFDKNANCEVKDETINEWRKGIRLYSTSKNYAIIAIEGFNGIAFRVRFDGFRMLEG